MSHIQREKAALQSGKRIKSARCAKHGYLFSVPFVKEPFAAFIGILNSAAFQKARASDGPDLSKTAWLHAGKKSADEQDRSSRIRAHGCLCGAHPFPPREGFGAFCFAFARKKPLSPAPHFVLYILPSMSRATAMPVQLACIRPRVMPAPSPMAYRPLISVSKLFWTGTLEE